MTKEQLTMLARIYNTLMMVNTKGEDTMTMGECLKALQQLIVELQKTENTQEE